MSKKDSRTTCDFINFVEATEKGKELMKSNKSELIGFYIIVAINTGLRVGDVKRLTFEDLRKGVLKFKEQKTKKFKELTINVHIQKAFENLSTKDRDGDIFKSQKNVVISTQHLNVLLKDAFAYLLPTHCISSHSLRKTFGRRVYEKNNRSEDALNYLSELFNHSSISTTRKYLGIRQEELNNIYNNL
jgi:integrase